MDKAYKDRRPEFTERDYTVKVLFKNGKEHEEVKSGISFAYVTDYVVKTVSNSEEYKDTKIKSVLVTES